jgi:hypothetical protein
MARKSDDNNLRQKMAEPISIVLRHCPEEMSHS